MMIKHLTGSRLLTNEVFAFVTKIIIPVYHVPGFIPHAYAVLVRVIGLPASPALDRA